jgi:hypothetical protein
MTAFNENCLFLFGAPRAPLAVRRASLREWGPQWGTGGGPTQGRAALAANQSRVHPFGGYAKVYNNEVIVAQFKSSPVYLTSAVDGILIHRLDRILSIGNGGESVKTRCALCRTRPAALVRPSSCRALSACLLPCFACALELRPLLPSAFPPVRRAPHAPFSRDVPLPFSACSRSSCACFCWYRVFLRSRVSPRALALCAALSHRPPISPRRPRAGLA